MPVSVQTKVGVDWATAPAQTTQAPGRDSSSHRVNAHTANSDAVKGD